MTLPKTLSDLQSLLQSYLPRKLQLGRTEAFLLESTRLGFRFSMQQLRKCRIIT